MKCTKICKIQCTPLLFCLLSYCLVMCFFAAAVMVWLKGLGHAILGNFSTDQMVIELTKI